MVLIDCVSRETIFVRGVGGFSGAVRGGGREGSMRGGGEAVAGRTEVALR